MKILQFLLFLSIVLTTLACQNKSTSVEKSIRKFHHEYKLKKFEQQGFTCRYTGCGSQGEYLTHLGIGFFTKQELNISTSRLLIVECVLEYINEINKNNDWKNHFTDWPLGPNNIEYTIVVDRGDGLMPKILEGSNKENKISYVEFDMGKIYYEIDQDTKTLPQTIHEETIEEAIAILKKEGWTEPVYE